MPIVGEMVLMSNLASQSADSAVWSDFYAPVNAKIVANTEMSASGRLTMVRGKGIHLSIRGMGIEGGVVYVNQDSIFIVDKINKVFVADDYASILGDYKLALEDLQSLLLGLPFKPSASLDSMTWGMVDKGVLNAVQFCMQDSAKAVCSYAERTHANSIDLPSSVMVAAYDLDRDVSPLSLWINYSVNNVKWNEKREIKFRRPSGYKLVNIKALLNALAKEMQASATDHI